MRFTVIIALLSALLFRTKYWICELFFKDELVNWWKLRVGLDTLNYALVFLIAYRISSGFLKAVFLVAMVYCGGDIIDRYYFNINEYHVNDLLLDLFAIYYLPKQYAREIKGST